MFGQTALTNLVMNHYCVHVATFVARVLCVCSRNDIESSSSPSIIRTGVGDQQYLWDDDHDDDTFIPKN